VQPDDAEVLREGKWIRYDHASLVVGDIIRLFEVCVVSNCIAPFWGNTLTLFDDIDAFPLFLYYYIKGDLVPADCTVISLGMDHVDATIFDEENTTSQKVENDSNGDCSEITVDFHLITGEAKPRQISNRTNGTVDSATLYYGSRVLEGACIAVVTGTGCRVVLAKLIKARRWPPSTDLSEEVEEINRLEHEIHRLENEEGGIALTPIS
jgi:magnesium-transporting ATPase (P-type)